MDRPGHTPLFQITIWDDFSLTYTTMENEILTRGWLDKAVEGVHDSMKDRARLIKTPGN